MIYSIEAVCRIRLYTLFLKFHIYIVFENIILILLFFLTFSADHIFDIMDMGLRILFENHFQIFKFFQLPSVQQ